MEELPEKIFVKDLSEWKHKPVDTSFFCKQKEIRKKKNGDDYLLVILSDRTGDIQGYVWENSAATYDLFETQDFVRVQALVREYNGRLQLNVQRVEKIAEPQVNHEDYFARSQIDSEELFAKLMAIVKSLNNRYLRELLNAVFSDPGISENFKRVPAGKSFHHSWIGGLLEHTLSVCTLCDLAASHYGGLDRDLLLAGAMLHDIGKTEELRFSKGFDYTDKGRLLGHIILGVEMVGQKADTIQGFPEALRLDLVHILLSHHNQLEFGSPRRPKTPEALLISHVDDMDAKLDAMRGLIQAEEHLEGNWTAYSQRFGRYIYKRPRDDEEQGE